MKPQDLKLILSISYSNNIQVTRANSFIMKRASCPRWCVTLNKIIQKIQLKLKVVLKCHKRRTVSDNNLSQLQLEGEEEEAERGK